MNDLDTVNFREDNELDYHLELVNKSKSHANRTFLRENTQWTAKDELGKKIITHKEFKPYVIADQSNLNDLK
ncbi:MAG: hypothetical protein VX100_08695 [Pseudomonadota bacterium]|uniref:hypothetical protein n=1 Tax=Pseudoalteromonas spongiae TaxID=298657 RepID=UPI00026CAF12|nr:hypothetical protein [Pseudoalteromonas spongiae]MEC8326161.1 hypothetical protein [Pseudomonadota bacterium]TMO82789.1 hypothetical protein CWC15_18030 [Pseudoalteromonas spongiae]